MKKLFKSNAFVFVLIVLVQVAYKMIFLDYWGFWHDEAFSLYYSQQHWGHLKHISEWDINPPLYYYFLWIWQHLFGIGEYAIRFSSVLFSALSAGMLYIISARNFNRATGLIAVLFFTVCNDMYFYSHEARPYTLIMFLVLCSSYFFLSMLQKPGWVNAFILGVLNFGLIYTHYVCGIIIAIQISVALIYFNKALLKFISVASGITILIALLRFTKKTIALVLHNEKSSFWIEKPTFRDLTDTLYSFFNGQDLFYIFLFAALVSLIYIARAKAWKPVWATNKMNLTYVLFSGAGALLICFFVSLSMPLFVRRYLLFTAPFIFIAMAYFISLADKSISPPLLAIVSLFMIFSMMRINFHTPKSMDYRGAVYLIKAFQKNNMPVLVETPDVGALFSYYYDRSIFTDYGNIEGRLKDKGIYMVANANDAKSVDLSKHNRIILTQTFEDVNPGNKELLKFISANYPQKITTKFYLGITINVYSK
jgi:4-amino-4-deoxy-L-arabinose transferase-like glycosyltransferase